LAGEARRRRRSEVASEIEGERERSARGAGLGRVTDPDPSRVGLAVPEWAGLGQLGQNRLWPFVLKQIFKFQI
jgi:hypothetical protein